MLSKKRALDVKNYNQFLDQTQSNLPELATTKDLIEAGIFSCVAQATQCRKRGDSPVFITLSKKRIMYPKEEVIAWLKMRTTSGENLHE